MADQTRCPACGGTGKGVAYWRTWAERAEAELDRVTRAAITGPDGLDYHWIPEQGWCPGHPKDSDESGPAGSPPELPADLINRAAQLALDEVPVIRDVMRFPDAVVTKMMLAAADPLIEHGRQQALRDVARNRDTVTEAAVTAEREKWEAQVEALDRSMTNDAGDLLVLAGVADSYGEERLMINAAELLAGYRSRLRSLLTGEGENGE